MTPARMRHILRSRGIPGVILDLLPLHAPELEFEWSGLACASIGYSYKTTTLHRAVNDQFHAVGLASLNLQSNHGAWSGINQNSRTIGATALELVVEQPQ